MIDTVRRKESLLAVFIGIGMVLCTLLLKVGVEHQLVSSDTTFLMFPASILVAAWFGGPIAGVSALGTSCAVIIGFFLTPERLFLEGDLTAWSRLCIFLLEGSLICAIVGRLQHSREIATATAEQARSAEHDAQVLLEAATLARTRFASLQSTYRRLVDSDVLAVMICRHDGEILEANDALLNLLESSRDQLAQGGLNWRDFTPVEFHDRDQQAIEEIQKTQKARPYEKEVVSARGTRRQVTVGAAATGNPGEIISFVVDDSEKYRIRRQLEDALLNAASASQVKSDFLANISHELRTPLNSIIGMIELTLDEQLDAGPRDYLETARVSARNLSSLISNILDFSRIEAGYIQLESAPFDLHLLIEQTLRTLSGRAQQRNIEMRQQIDPNVPQYVVGDKNRLRQVLVNVISNAIKFTEQGDITVSLQVNQVLSEQTVEVCFRIRDTGIGIAPADQERIFSPFTQADGSSTRTYGGTGLGLAICSEIVSRMSGRIELVSSPGQGSQFDILIPIEILIEETSAEFADLLAWQEMRGKRVLIVGDNANEQNQLQQILQKWKLETSVAASASEAIDVLQERMQESQPHFDVLLIDACLPEGNGIAFLRQARQSELLGGAAIVLLTAEDPELQLTAQELRDLQVARTVQKPISQTNLLDAMVKLFSEKERVEVRKGVLRKAARQKLQVLVAEDTRANQIVIGELLRRRGHEPTLAGNGQEAVEQLTHNHFDVVLMDMQMPVMDGFQATAAIRELSDPEKAGIPIVALTAHAMKGDRERCLKAGLDEYLTKPVDADQLFSILEQIVHPTDDAARYEKSASRDAPTEFSEYENVGAAVVDSANADFAAALQKMGEDRELFAEVARMFIADVPKLLEDLKTCCGQRDREKVRRSAYVLKGLVYNFGVSEAALEVLDEFEQADDAFEQFKADDACERLAARLRELTERLERFLRSYH